MGRPVWLASFHILELRYFMDNGTIEVIFGNSLIFFPHPAAAVGNEPDGGAPLMVVMGADPDFVERDEFVYNAMPAMAKINAEIIADPLGVYRIYFEPILFPDKFFPRAG